MAKFLLVLFWIIVIYYFFKWTMRYIAPFLMKKYVRKVQKNFEEQTKHNQPSKKKDSVNIDYSPEDDRKQQKDNLGEYVDYEEVE
ncbi:MAG: hypothetical protein JEY97_00160 [Bacteroidales bacterium]|nr:hypothetical protein [Bacteroidales bacterium]